MSGPDELERAKRALLDAAKGEQPSDAARAKGLEALLQGEVKPLDVDPPSLDPQAPVRPWVWLVPAAVLAFLLMWLNRADGTWPPPPVVDAGRPALVVVVDAGVAEPVPEPVVDAGVEAAVDAGVPDAGRVKVASPPVEEEDTLAAELALLDEARALLKVKPAEALKTLDAYRRRYPKGSLGLEADLVRVEALLGASRRGEAEALAKKLRAKDTGGLLGERLQRLFPDAG